MGPVQRPLIKGEFVGDVFLLVNGPDIENMKTGKISNQMCSFKSHLDSEDDHEAHDDPEAGDFKWIVLSCEETNMKNFTLDVPSSVKSVKFFQSECLGYECKENSHCQVQR